MVNSIIYYYKMTGKQNTQLIFFSHLKILYTPDRDFPGGAVVKTPCSQCRGPRFDPWSRLDPICVPELRSPPAATKTQHNQINKYFKNK